VIIDCSITMSWCFADEATPATSDVRDRLADEAALVPTHWFLEVANVLAMAERKNRISAADSTQFVQLLSALDIQSAQAFGAATFEKVLLLCSHRLTSYDAAYLDLALQTQLPLASLDDDLRAAATQLGISILGK
jgi:predicted nucleic acid-binding protein